MRAKGSGYLCILRWIRAMPVVCWTGGTAGVTSEQFCEQRLYSVHHARQVHCKSEDRSIHKSINVIIEGKRTLNALACDSHCSHRQTKTCMRQRNEEF